MECPARARTCDAAIGHGDHRALWCARESDGVPTTRMLRSHNGGGRGLISGPDDFPTTGAPASVPRPFRYVEAWRLASAKCQ